MFYIEHRFSTEIVIFLVMNGEMPPVLYSADLSGCKAIPQLTESEISEIFALVLQSARTWDRLHTETTRRRTFHV